MYTEAYRCLQDEQGLPGGAKGMTGKTQWMTGKTGFFLYGQMYSEPEVLNLIQYDLLHIISLIKPY